ncbi:helix-turn-helix domain-containing protein [Paenibacillus sp. MBLB4367]|uniref:helix-turn-helix domain-containing protein n=1 Tax=Paenibacillus sp. MBLB4367 TaxID=3384767 RepID=UPI003907EF2F
MRMPRLGNKNTLFSKLLISFFIIILVLLSFNFLSFLFFKNSINEEIIHNNSLTLNKTVDNYEKQIALINKNLTTLYFDARINLLKTSKNDHVNFEVIQQVNNELATLVSNELLYLDNILLVFKSASIVLDKDGIIDFDKMFSTFYVSSDYPQSFWERQFEGSGHLEILPASKFAKYSYVKNFVPPILSIPVVFHNVLDKEVYFVAFLDANKLFNNFTYIANGKFQILGSEGQLVYDSDEGRQPMTFLPTENKEGYLKKDDVYYFYKKSDKTGLTYINSIPNQTVAMKINQLSLILGALLVFSVIASLAISVFLSARFNHPFQRIIEAIKEQNGGMPIPTTIHEFKVINEKIQGILKTNRDVRLDLNKKNVLLKQYGYLKKMKNIETNLGEIRDLIDTSEPFHLSLFHIRYTQRFMAEFDSLERSKIAKVVQTFASTYTSEHFPGSVSMNMEKDLLCTVIFEKDYAHVLDKLNALKQVIDRDKEYYLLTIAIHPELTSFAELDSVYNESLGMIQARKLNEETQIVESNVKNIDVALQNHLQETEFWENLQHGNEANLMQIIQRTLSHFQKKSADAHQYHLFANQVIERVIKALIVNKQDISLILHENSPYEQIKYCHTLAQYESFFEQFLAEATSFIRQKRESNDPVVTFVTAYVNKHYGDDISLDVLADRLNLSSGYLSSYFKENFGYSFSEYLNEIRISKAKEMLMDSNSSIQQISFQVGYQNVSSFIRMFKRITGMPPGQYRRSGVDESEHEFESV